jgi:hypothetical protein
VPHAWELRRLLRERDHSLTLGGWANPHADPNAQAGYLADPDFNAEFHRAPAEPAPAFVPLGAVDLEQILCHQDERVVARDNTVALDGVVMQLAKQVGRRTCAGLHVLVRRHLNGQHSVWLGARRLGLFDARGRAVTSAAA